MSEQVWLDCDNTIERVLSVDGAAINHTLITRVQLRCGDTVLDSDDNPEYFDFTAADRLIIKLFDSGLATGRYEAKLKIFDETNTNGRDWGSPIVIVVDTWGVPA
jgi:hypothetical protein